MCSLFGPQKWQNTRVSDTIYATGEPPDSQATKQRRFCGRKAYLLRDRILQQYMMDGEKILKLEGRRPREGASCKRISEIGRMEMIFAPLTRAHSYSRHLWLYSPYLGCIPIPAL